MDNESLFDLGFAAATLGIPSLDFLVNAKLLGSKVKAASAGEETLFAGKSKSTEMVCRWVKACQKLRHLGGMIAILL